MVDNVWDDLLEQLLPGDIMDVVGQGSVVLVTSRDLGAAQCFGGAVVAEVGFLSDVDSMQLLCMRMPARLPLLLRRDR